ncbi:MAG: cold-shock protein [Candidatus Raymondbacteria bacterium RifOxyA12_full_50_37]|uniref:Cold-shock protein n=1 Tax=Candidatus Raymondbacteria bacterium RIFOXYD12_FULL_49_13 TaxID=1817890 RepID=A0A1F7FDI4_UNCRA|nr:MAG: cold-shock protein [Candidatus Raymondbacteria bacterium RifOxyA12_full_50_37]OGJ94100.1 MAG: cold-shock protein [Candidatus Raymondbacteria bacterium RIFOXYA2_FULL_49_16]OGJ96925.1 MAG: cold-shock protein [Candidatus Raymondbacteria bacterium RIFOXYC2_FULL_50_21]OGJ99495.1 MAG: cold-shock protein [Candidatus Raymondbacteria bacterium RifOxyB12_full_50_8]OGK04651.1 MAG: cold-shock protein [Candidatus Raymondbacteria bacterium RIFOXYD12_FULL_49_13]OGK06189.1 MAG: cold-shock protein [Can
MPKGKVKWFNDKKGFGFIVTEEGKDVFVHINDINRGDILLENEEVEFELAPGKNGQKAVNVSVFR